MALAQKHKPYYMIEGYAKKAGLSLDQLAEALEITRRTLDNKIYGRTFFTLPESLKIKKLLQQTIEDIFLQ